MASFGAADAAAFDAAAAIAKAYRESVGTVPVGPEVSYAQALARFGGPVPETGAPADAVVAELARNAEGGLLHMIAPTFHGWVIGASHPAGVAADWLASAWGQGGGISPAYCAVEQVAADWLLALLGLPAEAGVGFCTGATMANFTALAAARGELLRRAGWDVEARGLFGAPEIHVVLGAEAHSTVFLSLRLLGFGAERVHVVAADPEGRMRPEALAAVLNGIDGPVVLILQAGNVVSGAFDPFAELIGPAKRRGAWVHVDGAFGLWALAAPALAALTDGLAEADSWAADGHKWLQVPYDCGFAIVRDARAQQRAMNVTASYLPEGEDRHPEAFSPELSRRARGFAVWAVIKALGRSGVAEMVERHCAVAKSIAARLSAEPGIAVLNEVVLNQVAFACGEGAEADRLTRATLAEVQAEGIAYPSHGRWRGREIIRVSVTAGPTGLADGARTAEAIIAAWRRVAARSA